MTLPRPRRPHRHACGVAMGTAMAGTATAGTATAGLGTSGALSPSPSTLDSSESLASCCLMDLMVDLCEKMCATRPFLGASARTALGRTAVREVEALALGEGESARDPSERDGIGIASVEENGTSGALSGDCRAS